MGDESRMTAETVRACLTGESPGFDHQRRIFRHIPSSPRCKFCAAPFGGLGALLLNGIVDKRVGGEPGIRGRVERIDVLVLRPAEVLG